MHTVYMEEYRTGMVSQDVKFDENKQITIQKTNSNENQILFEFEVNDLATEYVDIDFADIEANEIGPITDMSFESHPNAIASDLLGQEGNN